ncbi:MAG: glycosyltransferase family 2 protein [Bacteroidales bacterium]|nr:glycosyltransferase family 2 protein [Bacteroidales bacterium]
MNVDVSIVVPVYYNEGSLEPLVSAIKNEVISKNAGRSFEIVFVDDGSGDNSFLKLMELREQNQGLIKVVKLSRNFGQVNAIRAGLHHSKGKATVIMSADLQDPPGLINDMIHHHFNEGHAVVICARESREESQYRVLTSRFYFWLLKKLAFKDMPPGGFDYYLINDKVRDLINKYEDRGTGIKTLIFYAGFKPKFIYYTRLKRRHGKSTYNFSKKFNQMVRLVMSYSFLPIRIISLIGAITALVGFVWAAISLYYIIFVGMAYRGTRVIFVLILTLSGLQILMTGILGEYLWRAFDQIRNRPKYIIDEIYE